MSSFLRAENARTGFEFEESDSVSSEFLNAPIAWHRPPRAILQQNEPLYVESSGEEEARLHPPRAMNEPAAPRVLKNDEASALADNYERTFFSDFLVSRVRTHNKEVQLYRNYDAYDQETANMRGQGPVSVLFFDSNGKRALALKAAFERPSRSSHTNEHVYTVPYNRWVFKLTKVNEFAIHNELRRVAPEVVAPLLQHWDLAYLNGHFYHVKIMPRGRVGVPQVNNANIVQYDRDRGGALLTMQHVLGEILQEREGFRVGADTLSAKNRAYIEGGWKMFDFDNEMKNTSNSQEINVPEWMRELANDDRFLDLDELEADDEWQENIGALKKAKEATFADNELLSERERRAKKRTGEDVSFGLQARVEKDASEYPVRVAEAKWGRGLFAERDIAAGEVVAEFGGMLVDKFEFVKSLPWRAAQRAKSYLVDLLGSGTSAGLLSMGARGLYTNDEKQGNQGVGLFCNFSGNANCERVVMLDEKRGTARVILKAKREIKKDEELYSSYSSAYNARLKQLNKKQRF